VALLSHIALVDGWEAIRDVAGCLARDPRAREIELVLVTPSAEALSLPDGEVGALAGVRVVELPLVPMNEARAAAVRAATGEIVALGETHAFPAPGSLDALLAAYGEGVGSVIPRIENGNPDGPLSWVACVMDYGRWTGTRAGDTGVAPSYNATFRREALLGLGAELPALLSVGAGLSRRLRAAGHRLVRAPGARLHHLNVSQPLHWAVERFLGGRLTGAARACTWPRSRRAAYVLGSPLIALLLTARALRDARRARLSRPRWSLPALLLGAKLWALGEAVGYAAGAGRAEERMLEYELHKERYVGVVERRPAEGDG
jgi:hypothetical protein